MSPNAETNFLLVLQPPSASRDVLEKNMEAFGVAPCITLTSEDTLEALKDERISLVLVNSDFVTAKEISKIRSLHPKARVRPFSLPLTLSAGG